MTELFDHHPDFDPEELEDVDLEHEPLPPARELKRIGATMDRMVASRAFIVGAMGPVGSGKTIGMSVKFQHHAAKQKGKLNGQGQLIRKARYVFIRDTYPNLDRNTIPSWNKVVPRHVGRFVNSAPRVHKFSMVLQRDGHLLDKDAKAIDIADVEIEFRAIGDQTVEDALRGLEWTGSYSTVPTPDTCCANSSSAGAEIRFSFPASPTISGVDLFWIGTSNGVAEYSWDGASWTTINVQGPVGACSFAAITGFPSGVSGILRVRVVSGTCSIGGVNFKSAAPGVVFHKLAATGSRMQQLATQSAVASWRTAVAALGINTAMVMHGTNDQGASRSAQEFAADATTVMNNLNTAIPGLDRFLIMPPENQRPDNPIQMKVLKAAAAEVAATLGIPFLDTQWWFGDPDNPTEYGFEGAFPLFSSDLIHPFFTTGGPTLHAAITSFMHR